MLRRNFVQGGSILLLSSLAGCIFVSPGDNEGNENEVLASVTDVAIRSFESLDDYLDQRDVDDPNFDMTVESLAAFDIHIHAEVLDETATIDSPPRIEFTFEHTGDEPRTFYTSAAERIPTRYGPIVGESDTELFLPSADWDVERVADDCLQAVRWPHSLEPAKPVEFEPDSTVTNVTTVWGYHGDDFCLPPGVYRFEQMYRSEDATAPSAIWELDIELT